MIDIKEIKKTCPKAYKLLGEWIEKQLEKFQAMMAQNEEGMKVEKIPDVDDKIIEGMLMWNLRQLFSFFDDNQVFISINYADSKWVWDINNDDPYTEKTRMEAENKVFTEAFNQLEKL